MKPLVTGAGGFAGSHLCERLAARLGGPIDGTVLREAEAQDAPWLRPHVCDVTRREELGRLLFAVRPTHLFHLAAPAHVGESFERPAEAVAALASGTIALLEEAAKLPSPPRVLLVSSAEVYGWSGASGQPLTEASPLEPHSPYGVGKLAAEAYGRLMFRRGLALVIARPFNHIGPRQSDRFACAAFARQIAEAEAGVRPPSIGVGNLTAERDFSDVRDVVAGYERLLEQGAPGEAYNVASGQAVRMSELLSRLVGMARRPIEVTTEPARVRPVELPRLVGDAGKLRALGWAPTVALSETLADTLEYWRARVGRGRA
ncbi:MAG: GDP-mannose 4,6-dehydratase [Deltaproteobacteria bacterium]